MLVAMDRTMVRHCMPGATTRKNGPSDPTVAHRRPLSPVSTYVFRLKQPSISVIPTNG